MAIASQGACNQGRQSSKKSRERTSSSMQGSMRVLQLIKRTYTISELHSRGPVKGTVRDACKQLAAYSRQHAVNFEALASDESKVKEQRGELQGGGFRGPALQEGKD
jgi:hypothetical protein